MKCLYCSTDNKPDAKFCINCGKPLVLSDIESSSNLRQQVPNNTISTPKMTPPKLVPAKCTNCGATLTLNPSDDASICPFCNSAFIVDKAIQNYNTYNVENNVTINDYKADNEWTYKSNESKKQFELDKMEKRNEIIVCILGVILMIVMYYFLYKLQH